jgi:hypothetical protein
MIEGEEEGSVNLKTFVENNTEKLKKCDFNFRYWNDL